MLLVNLRSQNVSCRLFLFTLVSQYFPFVKQINRISLSVLPCFVVFHLGLPETFCVVNRWIEDFLWAQSIPVHPLWQRILRKSREGATLGASESSKSQTFLSFPFSLELKCEQAARPLFLLCSLLLLFYFNRVEGKYPLRSLHSALWASLDYVVRSSHNFSFTPAQVLSKCRNL